MTNEQKKEIARELMTNMCLTKEQYIEACKLCDDLDLVPDGDEPETIDPEDMDWDDILDC